MTDKILHTKKTIEARKKIFDEMREEQAKVVEVKEVDTPTEKDK